VGILTDALREGPRSWQPPLARPCRIFFCAVKWAGWEGASGRLPPSLDSLKRHGARNYRMAGAFLPSRGRGTAAVGVCFLLHRQSSRINAPHHFHQPELERRGGWARAGAEPDPSITASLPAQWSLQKLGSAGHRRPLANPRD
jgi:hypothetical protein